MTKVFPNGASSSSTDATQTVLTVWKKSMLLNCEGFTVFDANGNLAYRVDNYLAGNKAQILLMDAAGNPLFTIRRKRLSLADSWVVYEGESGVNPRFSARKQMNLLKSKCLARIVEGSWSGMGMCTYEIEGCYGKRCCAVYDEKRRIVAEIKRKEATGGMSFGMDVFRLVVQPQIDTTVAMALLVLLDQMFGSSTP
ncbi:protein LURP-one-related 8 isoform X1 [Cucurbita pepo subsp. pepo]|uniref:protein LURP-one-related 8 isoform X1 n=1 Tax=Cucurbita pepo subsp. pepo TaxID=3664 RepID=UPI000C9D2FB6|nr:protein LURP-one-related 8 isoform X1 [Cucurbita pepo subsp. pepo]